jgi:hypothetical protein
MGVKVTDIPQIILDRVADWFPQHAVFDIDEISAWPDWALGPLVEAGLLQEGSRATKVFCDGCEWGCLKPVIVRTLPSGRKSRAFVVCDEEPGLGRIEVAPEQLKRYIATAGLATMLVGRSIGLKSSARPGSGASLVVGHIKGRNGHRLLSVEVRQGQLLLTAGGHRIALGGLVHWNRRALAVDEQAIRRLVNRKATRSGPEYPLPSAHPMQDRRKKAKRDQQIRREATRLQHQNRNWNVTRISNHISRTELAGGISAARVRRILYEQNS